MWIPILFLVTHIVLSVFVQRRLNRCVHFERNRVLHTILLWLIPYLWAGLLYYFTKPKAIEIQLQDKEKTIRENWGQPLGRSNWTSIK